ncbi:hypothetical protein BDQ12DRAFT_670969 [Crucibulum laeve]|uniref:Uncharacterized protein n=1 Tax=Crucibulum laeve TaxID=68775 RepID=A0A5C3LIE5_9AGAR|nr:hypothetical protein BDQ12DRAFT_670969 [Crucibulum laeve]
MKIARTLVMQAMMRTLALAAHCYAGCKILTVLLGYTEYYWVDGEDAAVGDDRTDDALGMTTTATAVEMMLTCLRPRTPLQWPASYHRGAAPNDSIDGDVLGYTTIRKILGEAVEERCGEQSELTTVFGRNWHRDTKERMAQPAEMTPRPVLEVMRRPVGEEST